MITSITIALKGIEISFPSSFLASPSQVANHIHFHSPVYYLCVVFQDTLLWLFIVAVSWALSMYNFKYSSQLCEIVHLTISVLETKAPARALRVQQWYVWWLCAQVGIQAKKSGNGAYTSAPTLLQDTALPTPHLHGNAIPGCMGRSEGQGAMNVAFQLRIRWTTH